MRSIILFAAILTFSESALLAGSAYVPITIARDGIVFVPMLVNGQGPFPFVVDTGSNRTAVAADLAQTLGLPIVAKTEVIGVTGREYRPVVRLAGSIGSSPAVTLLASVVPDAKLRQAAGSRSARGVIGQDLLMTLNYTLDYARQRFVLSAPQDRDGSSIELPIEIDEGRVIVALPSDAGQPPLRLVPDSGATMFVVFGRGGRPPFAMEPINGMMQIEAISSAGTAAMVRLREVRLKALTLRDQIAAFVDRSYETSLAIDGLLPLQIFATVTFDAEGRRMIVTPRR
jgi:hypothetical protein